MSRLLLLPGWGMENAVWEPILEDLSQEIQLDSFDWRGVKSLAEFSSRVVTYLNHQQPKSLILLGWSLGSLVALDIARQYPSIVSKIILVGGTSRFTALGREYEAGWHARIVERMKRQLARDPDKTLKAFYTSMFSRKELEQGYDHRFLTDIQTYFEGDDLESLILGLDYLLQVDYRNALTVQAPILLIHGEEDEICPLGAARYISEQAKSAVLRTIPGAGHIPFYTKPGLCLEWVKAFLMGELLD